jgi:hypothetical protein
VFVDNLPRHCHAAYTRSTPSKFGTMAYGAEPCHLGAIGHDANSRFKVGFASSKSVNINIFLKKGQNCKKEKVGHHGTSFMY